MKLINIKPRKSTCKHLNVEVDMDMRTIDCTSCGALIDPIEWIFKVGIEEELLMGRIRVLEKQIATLESQRIKLLTNK